MNKYVIVGGVAGGAGTAARLRRLDEHADIVIFERGKYISFANCGLPYYAGGVIKNREDLFVMTPEKLKAHLNITAKVKHEVLSINTKQKTVRVRNLNDNSEFDEPYDKLVLSPGAVPIRPPIPGIDDKAIFTLRTVDDIDAVKAVVDSGKAKRAVVVGGGFIGLEMAENLHKRGLHVTIAEALPQVMNVIDFDMAAIVQSCIREKGVNLCLNDGVKNFERRGEELAVVLNSQKEILCDIVILSIGVRPDTAIAKAAGLPLAQNGAIKMDDYFNTPEKDIYAVGDAVEFTSPLLNMPVTIPLAGPANKQARICAGNIIFGNTYKYSGTIGTSIAKVFDLTVAAAGLSGKALAKAGIPFKEVITHAPNHAKYYPDFSMLSIKILYEPKTGKLLGAQAVGANGADKRIDVLAAYIKMGGTIFDIVEFEQAYAPPFSSAKDPINMLGFIAENEMKGLTALATWENIPEYRSKGAFFLDVRTNEEFSLGALEGAVNIPHTELRKNLDKVPKDKPIFINCAIGLRGYLAARILLQNGYKDVINLSGGYTTYSFIQKEKNIAG